MVVFVEENTFEKARKKIRENKDKKIIFSSDDDELNRKILEKEKIDVLLLKQKGRKDRMKQRDSGLDLVMAKIAKKEEISIGIYLDEILESSGKIRAEILSRIEQNIRICKKNNLKIEFISQKSSNKRDSHDLRALGLSLGIPTQIVKDL